MTGVRRKCRSWPTAPAAPAAMLALALVATSCGGNAVGTATPLPARPPVPVGLATLTVLEEPLVARKSARLMARVDLDLAVESAGVVRRRLVPEGARVEAGEPLLDLQDAAEEAEVLAAQARLAMLETEPTDLSTRQAAEAALALAQEMLRRRRLVAPASGVLTRFHVDEGEHVLPGTRVARLVDPDRLYVVTTVLESEVLQVDREHPARVTVGPIPGATFAATIVRVAPAATPGSGFFEVEADLAPDPRLRAGFQATVDLPLAGKTLRRVIPRDAVFVRHGTERVFAAEPRDGQPIAVERVVVTRVVPWRPDLADVVEGLEDGASVVVRGRLGLIAGDRLVPTSQ